MILDHFPASLKPLIQPIDTWFENRRLALAFEAVTGGGKLLVCSIDLDTDLMERPVSRQLLHSILLYMNSDGFDPGVQLEPDQIRKMLAYFPPSDAAGGWRTAMTDAEMGILMKEHPDFFPDGLDKKIFAPGYFPSKAFPPPDPWMEDIGPDCFISVK